LKGKEVIWGSLYKKHRRIKKCLHNLGNLRRGKGRDKKDLEEKKSREKSYQGE